MARAFWKGAISFGMVNIPVRMYVATVNATPNFHLLHKKCLTRPKQVLYCEKDDEYFKRQDTVRGYEYAKGQFVVMKESEFDNVPLRSTRAIEIVGFVGTGEIDPIYFYDSHYLEPEELAAKPFCLLREALRKTGRLGIAKVSFARREHLACLRPRGNLLLLHTMHYQPEIIPEDQINVPEKEVSAGELEMAQSLIKIMEKKFDPSEYRDEYRQALEEIVQAKLKGVEVKEIEEMPRFEEIPDLMSALKASVEAAARESATKPKPAAAAKKK
jgi:DNA end-binding protein Ku